MTTQEIIMLACALGFGYSCWKAGLKQGADNCIELLRSKKILTLDNKGNIKPNLFWQPPEEEED